MRTLDERRKQALKKFAEKAVASPQFTHWFPKNQNQTSQRLGKVYEEKHARSDRLYYSPLYTMRRALNNNEEKRTSDIHYIDLSNLFNEP